MLTGDHIINSPEDQQILVTGFADLPARG